MIPLQLQCVIPLVWTLKVGRRSLCITYRQHCDIKYSQHAARQCCDTKHRSLCLHSSATQALRLFSTYTSVRAEHSAPPKSANWNRAWSDESAPWFLLRRRSYCWYLWVCIQVLKVTVKLWKFWDLELFSNEVSAGSDQPVGVRKPPVP